jgi:hypothetical protein
MPNPARFWSNGRIPCHELPVIDSYRMLAKWGQVTFTFGYSLKIELFHKNVVISDKNIEIDGIVAGGGAGGPGGEGDAENVESTSSTIFSYNKSTRSTEEIIQVLSSNGIDTSQYKIAKKHAKIIIETDVELRTNYIYLALILNPKDLFQYFSICEENNPAIWFVNNIITYEWKNHSTTVDIFPLQDDPSFTKPGKEVAESKFLTFEPTDKDGNQHKLFLYRVEFDYETDGERDLLLKRLEKLALYIKRDLAKIIDKLNTIPSGGGRKFANLKYKNKKTDGLGSSANFTTMYIFKTESSSEIGINKTNISAIRPIYFPQSMFAGAESLAMTMYGSTEFIYSVYDGVLRPYDPNSRPDSWAAYYLSSDKTRPYIINFGDFGSIIPIISAVETRERSTLPPGKVNCPLISPVELNFYDFGKTLFKTLISALPYPNDTILTEAEAIELCKGFYDSTRQEFFDCSEEEFAASFNIGVYSKFNSFIHYRVLEKLFRVNIIVINIDADNKGLDIIEIPRHSNFHVRKFEFSSTILIAKSCDVYGLVSYDEPVSICDRDGITISSSPERRNKKNTIIGEAQLTNILNKLYNPLICKINLVTGDKILVKSYENLLDKFAEVFPGNIICGQYLQDGHVTGVVMICEEVSGDSQEFSVFFDDYQILMLDVPIYEREIGISRKPKLIQPSSPTSSGETSSRAEEEIETKYGCYVYGGFYIPVGRSMIPDSYNKNMGRNSKIILSVLRKLIFPDLHEGASRTDVEMQLLKHVSIGEENVEKLVVSKSANPFPGKKPFTLKEYFCFTEVVVSRKTFDCMVRYFMSEFSLHIMLNKHSSTGSSLNFRIDGLRQNLGGSTTEREFFYLHMKNEAKVTLNSWSPIPRIYGVMNAKWFKNKEKFVLRSKFGNVIFGQRYANDENLGSYENSILSGTGLNGSNKIHSSISLRINSTEVLFNINSSISTVGPFECGPAEAKHKYFIVIYEQNKQITKEIRKIAKEIEETNTPQTFSPDFFNLTPSAGSMPPPDRKTFMTLMNIYR